MTDTPRTRNKRQKKLVFEKDKRSYWLSHEAHLYLQALAAQQGLETPQFLEVISRDLAQERLPDTQRVSIKAEADRITAERRNAALTPDR